MKKNEYDEYDDWYPISTKHPIKGEVILAVFENDDWAHPSPVIYHGINNCNHLKGCIILEPCGMFDKDRIKHEHCDSSQIIWRKIR